MIDGYPWFVPYDVLSAEFLGAICLIPGIYARWVAIYAVPMMFGAAHFWLVRKGIYFTGAGSELPAVWGNHGRHSISAPEGKRPTASISSSSSERHMSPRR